VDLVVGTITAAADLVGGRGPSYELTLDLGPRGVRKAFVATGAEYRDRAALVGTQVLCSLEGSEANVLFADSHGKGFVLVRPDADVEDGTVVA
jgi:prepilin-type processing-associated H-X9-DG protein